MKRCQKCNRTYPDESQKFCTVDGGLLVSADQAFDPNATIHSTASNMSVPPASKDQTVDLNATIATASTAETAVLPRNTGPTGSPTFAREPSAPLPPQVSQPPQAPQPPQGSQTTRLVPQQQSAPLPTGPTGPAAAAQKKSKLPLILGALALLLVLGVGAVVALFFLVIKPRLDEGQSDGTVVTNRDTGAVDENLNSNSASNTNTADDTAPSTEPEFTPPVGAIRFENSQANLDGKLAEHYLDFSFYYPKTWTMDPKAGKSGASNFVKVEETQEDKKGIYLVESANVSWYNSNGTFESDSAVFPDRVKDLEAVIAPGYPGYQKVSEGETLVNAKKAYEFRFMGTFKNAGEKDLPYWGRVILIPTGDGQKTGAVITLLATSLASEITSAEDLGEEGEMSLILKSFKFRKTQ